MAKTILKAADFEGHYAKWTSECRVYQSNLFWLKRNLLLHLPFTSRECSTIERHNRKTQIAILFRWRLFTAVLMALDWGFYTNSLIGESTVIRIAGTSFPIVSYSGNYKLQCKLRIGMASLSGFIRVVFLFINPCRLLLAGFTFIILLRLLCINICETFEVRSGDILIV